MSDYKQMTLDEYGKYDIRRDVLANLSIKGDEYYTLPQHVNDIADCLNVMPSETIWCPFDNDESYFPKILRERGYKVVNTSTDFFTTEPPGGAYCIVSNPPFSLKRKILEHITEDLGVRYALILPHLWINDGVPFDHGHQLILWRKRLYFNTPDGVANRPRTTCFVLSNGLLRDNLTIYHDR